MNGCDNHPYCDGHNLEWKPNSGKQQRKAEEQAMKELEKLTAALKVKEGEKGKENEKKDPKKEVKKR